MTSTSSTAAQSAWAALPGAERAAKLREVAKLLEQHRREFQYWLIREGGAVPGKAAFEVDLVLGELWEAAALPTQPCRRSSRWVRSLRRWRSATRSF